MEKLVYFRIIYEYEKQNNVLERIKAYIHGNKAGIIKDLCLGKLHLPSPFLLDELEWSLDITNHKVKEIIYQLKVTSREFYLSLIKLESRTCGRYFDSISRSLGKKMICDLINLQIRHAGMSHSIIDKLSVIFSKLSIFSSIYPNIFRGGYAILTGLLGISGLSVYQSFAIYNSVGMLLLPSVIGVITSIGFLTLERQINIFEKVDVTGKNLLAIILLSEINRAKSL